MKPQWVKFVAHQPATGKWRGFWSVHFYDSRAAAVNNEDTRWRKGRSREAVERKMDRDRRRWQARYERNEAKIARKRRKQEEMRWEQV